MRAMAFQLERQSWAAVPADRAVAITVLAVERAFIGAAVLAGWSSEGPETYADRTVMAARVATLHIIVAATGESGSGGFVREASA